MVHCVSDFARLFYFLSIKRSVRTYDDYYSTTNLKPKQREHGWQQNYDDACLKKVKDELKLLKYTTLFAKNIARND